MSLFNSATVQQIQALARCGTPEMAPLVELLTTALARAQDQLVKAESTSQIYRLQGIATALNDLLLGIKKAPDALTKLG